MFRKSYVFALLSLGSTVLCAHSTAWAAEKPKTEEATVLSHGPVHEAFAEPVLLESQQGIVAPKQPPETIEEIPPNVRPEGKNVQWIPGYWAWEEQRKDFLWVSGVWRDAPPDQRWVPGYWTEVEGGHTWVSGFWIGDDVAQVEYLPHPPASLEEGAQSPSPSESHFWVPGNWQLREQRYVWRPGYWQEGHENWVWVPARYYNSPRGSIYAAGYWDYDLPRRGILFSPVYYDRPVYTQAGYSYTPHHFVDLALITGHLFVHARHRHYYFGDYYAADFAKAGIHPWFEFHAGRRGYDPIFAYRHWQEGRGSQQWSRQLEQRYQHLQENEAERPARTLAGSPQSLKRDAGDRSGQLTRSIDAALADANAPLRVERLDDDMRKVVRENARQLQQFRQLRSQQELKLRSELQAKAGRQVDSADVLAKGKDAKSVTAFKLPEGYQPSSFELPKSQRLGQAQRDAQFDDARGDADGKPSTTSPRRPDIRVPDRPDKERLDNERLDNERLDNQRLGENRERELSRPRRAPLPTQTDRQPDADRADPPQRSKQPVRDELPKRPDRQRPALPDRTQTDRQQVPDRGGPSQQAQQPQRDEPAKRIQRQEQPKQIQRDEQPKQPEIQRRGPARTGEGDTDRSEKKQSDRIQPQQSPRERVKNK